MWYVIGAVAAVFVVRSAIKQNKLDEERRKKAWENFVNNFPGWGE